MKSPSITQPDSHYLTDAELVAGMLTPFQLLMMAELYVGLHQMKDEIERLNALAEQLGIPLRRMPGIEPALMLNDLSRSEHLHKQAEERISKAAFKVIERRAA